MGAMKCHECDAQVKAKGLCWMHYQRQRRTGSVALSQRPPFWDYVDRRGPDECWPWKGPTEAKGYGVYYIDGGKVAAHREAFERSHGPLADGLVVRHKECDNPPCCNPRHLASGSQADNIADKVARNRQARGERVGKLTSDAVREIKARLAAGERVATVASDHHVRIQCVYRIKYGETLVAPFDRLTFC